MAYCLNSSEFEEWDEFFQKNCNPISEFKIVSRIGQGTFGEVFKGVHIKTNTPVAMKRMKEVKVQDDLPTSALDEISLLKKCRSPNIVTFLGVGQGVMEGESNSSFFLNFELCTFDLEFTIFRMSKIGKKSEDAVSKILRNILEGVHYLHIHLIMHRDIKPANILFKDGVAKLADLGCATDYRRPRKRSCHVGTRGYKAPELLMGERYYGTAVDMWSVGVTFVEVIMGLFLFDEKDVSDQLLAISEVCGAMTPDVWPGVDYLPEFENMTHTVQHTRKLKQLLQRHTRDPALVDLVDQLLSLDPAKRPNSNRALQHKFFNPDPILNNNNNNNNIHQQQSHHPACHCDFPLEERPSKRRRLDITCSESVYEIITID